MKKIILTFISSLLIYCSQALVYFSQGSGALNTLSNWNTNRTGGGSTPANFTTAGDIFVIQGMGGGYSDGLFGASNHAMTLGTTLTIGTAANNTKLEIEAGASLTCTSALTFAAAGIFQLDAAAGIYAGGAYYHNHSGAFTAILGGVESFAASSNFYVAGSASPGTGPATANLTGNFGNFIFAPTSATTMQCNDVFPDCSGSLTQQSSTAEFRLAASTASGGSVLNIAGNLNISAGIFSFGTGSVAGSINLSGNFNMTGGTLQQACTGGASGAEKICTINFSKSGTQVFTKSAGTITSASSSFRRIAFVVLNNSILDMSGSNTVLDCAGSSNVDFYVNSGGSILMANAGGIVAQGTSATTGHIQTSSTSIRSFSTSGNYTYTGTASSAITGTGLPATVNNLTFSNSSGVTLTGSVTVSNILALTSGVVTTAANVLSVATTGSTSRTSGWVNGNLQKLLASPTSSATFEIGDAATNYTPVSLTFVGNVTNGGTTNGITFYTTAGDHAQIATAGIDNTKSVNRTWTMANSGVTVGTSISATFNFVAGDIDGGATTSNFVVKRYNSSTWNSTTLGTANALNTSVTGLGVADVGDFQIGEAGVASSIVTGSVGGPTFCAGASVTVPYTANGTYTGGNVFTAQLSSAAGSFASPVNIGTVTATTSGNISATIPANTAGGTLYRIRVVSSTPSITGSDNGVDLTINALPVITTQPSNTTTYPGTNVNPTFTVATSTGGTTFDWQYSSNGSSGWASVTTSPPTGFSYSGATGATLTVSTTTSAATGTYYYRCVITVTATGCNLASSTATLTVNTPPDPTITSISPTAKTEGDPSFTLTVNGTNFVSGISTINWNGTPVTTTFVSATQLTATIPASYVQVGTAGSVSITVVTTGATNPTSNSATLTINSATAPVLTVTPSATPQAFGNVINTQQSAEQTFTISGTNLSTADIVIGPFTGYSFSTTSGSGYQTTLNITQGGGSYGPTTIYMVFTPSGLGTYNGNVPIGGGGATTVNLAVTGTGIAASTSTITLTGGYTYTANIPYISYPDATPVTSANSVGVMGLTLNDLGGDGLSTSLTAITFSIAAATGNSISRAALFDVGTNTNIGEVTVANGATSIAFSTGASTMSAINAANGGSTAFELRVCFKTTQTDNYREQFTVSAATASTSGSTLASFGVSSSVSGNDNKVAVTATKLVFTTQPSSTANVLANLATVPVVAAQDANGNVDVDFTYASGLVVANSGSIGMNNTPVAPTNVSNGVLSFPSGFQFTTTGVVTLTVAATGVTTTPNSNTVTITDATLSSDYFRSTGAGGAWNATATWESSHDSSTWIAATAVPTSASNTITIRSGSPVNVTASMSSAAIDQLIIKPSATLTVNSGFTLNFGRNASQLTLPGDVVVLGTLVNSGGITQSGGSTMFVTNGGIYQHNLDGGLIPTATWQDGSTVNITGIVSQTTMTAAGLNQSFYNFTWNCTGQTSAAVFNLSGNLKDISSSVYGVRGDFRVTTTAAGTLRFTGTTTLTLTIGGNLYVDAGLVEGTGSGGIYTLNVLGSVYVSGGTLKSASSSSATANWNVTNDFVVQTEGIYDINGSSSSSGATNINIGRDMLISTTNATPGIRGVIGSSTGGFTLNITNDLTISGGAKFQNATGNASGKTFAIKLGGNFSLTGTGSSFVYANTSSSVTATFTLSGAATGFSGGRTNATFNIGAGTTFTQFASPNGWDFVVTNAQIANKKVTLSSNIALGGKTFSVTNAGGSDVYLDCGTNAITGAGGFSLGSGATLITANTNGVRGAGTNGSIQTSGSNTFNSGAYITYNGSAAAQSTGLQNVTFTTVNTLAGVTFSNTFSTPQVTMDKDIIVTGTVTLGNCQVLMGAFNLSANTLSGGSSSYYFVTNSTGALKLPGSGSAVLYPIGPTTSLYNPATLTNSGTADNYSVRVTSGAINSAICPSNDPTVLLQDAWTITEDVTGGSALTLQLQWNASAPQTQDEGSAFVRGSNLFVGRYTGAGTSWDSYTTTAVGSNPFTATTAAGVISTIGSGGSTLTVGNFPPPAGITLNEISTIAGANIVQGSTNNVFYNFSLALNNNSDATLTQLTVPTTGSTFTGTDFVNFKLWFNTSNNGPGAGATAIKTITSPATGTQTFSALTQSITKNTTGYFWVTADVSGCGAIGNTLLVSPKLDNTNFTFGATVTFTNGTTNIGGTQTIVAGTPDITLNSTTTIAAGVIGTSSTNNIIYDFNMVLTKAGTTVTQVTVPVSMTSAADFTNLQLWYGTTSAFGSATSIKTITPGGSGTETFSGLSQAITVCSSATTAYFWVTADVAAGATVGNTIQVATALASGNITLSTGSNYTSTTTVAGGLKTITVPSSPTGYFRTVASGDWTSLSIWEASSTGSAPWYSATLAPTNQATSVAIQNTDAVTVTSAVTPGIATSIATGAKLTVSGSGTFNTTGTVVTVNGTIENAVTTGNPFTSTSTTLVFSSTGVFDLTAASVSTSSSVSESPYIPTATWSTGSTCKLTGIVGGTGWDFGSTSPNGLNGVKQTFSNFTIDCPNLLGKLVLAYNGANSNPKFAVAGNFYVKNLGSGSLQLCSSNRQDDIVVSGNYTQDAGTVAIVSGTATAATRTFTVSGNFTMNNTCTFNILGATGGVYTNAANLLIAGNLTMASGATLTKTTTGASTVNSPGRLYFNGSSPQTAVFGNVTRTNAGAGPSTGVFNMFVTGSGGVTLNSNLTVPDSISITGGNFTVSPGYTMTLSSTTALDISVGRNLQIDGTVLNQGRFNTSPSAWNSTNKGTWTVSNTGTYIQNNANAISAPLNTAVLANSSTFIYRGPVGASYPSISISGRTYGNLVFESNSGAINLPDPASIQGAGTLTVNGNLSIGGTFGLGTVNYSWAAGSTPFTGAVNVLGNVTIVTGNTLTANNNNISVAGNWTNSGTFVPNTSTVIFNSSSANQSYTQTGTGNFNNLTISNTFTNGTVTMNNDATVNSITSLANGILSINGNTLNCNGTITRTNGTISGSSTSNMSFGGSTSNSLGSFLFTSAGTAVLNNFTMNSSGTTPSLTLNGTTGLQMAGTMTIGANNTFDLGTNALSDGGSFASSINATGTLKSQNTSATPLPSGKTWGGTVSYYSTSAQTIIDGNYNNLTGTGGDRTMNPTGTVGIAGVFTPGSGNYTFTGSTVDYNGSGAQNVQGFTYNNLTVSNANTKSLAAATGVEGALTMSGSSTLALDNFDLTLKSLSTKTARVAPVTTTANPPVTYGTGRFVVERYYPAKRSWRLVTAPLSGTGSIYDTWQNSGVYTPGIGTFVTGPNPTGGSGNGLDYSVQNNYSLKKYVNNAYVNVGNTITANLSGSGTSAQNEGYFLFVRGDRNRTPDNTVFGNSNNTTLSSRGKLQYAAQSFSISNTSGTYSLIGNPYASPVDFNLVTKTNVYPRRFYVFDPSLGNVGLFVTMEDFGTPGVFTPTSPFGASSQDNNIQSSQAFFVQPDVLGTSASVDFAENQKSTTNNLAMFRPSSPAGANNIAGTMQVDMFYQSGGSTVLADGTYAEFDNSYDKSITIEDALKFSNIDENVAFERYGQTMSVERRATPVANDTMFLKIWRVNQSAYQLRFITRGLSATGLVAYLEDSYTGVPQLISLDGTTTVNISFDASAASKASNRFRVVFAPTPGPLPVSFTTVNAWKQGADIAVEWKVANQLNIDHYEVEKSTDGRNFSKSAEQPALNTGASSISYNWIDRQPSQGINYYRIRSVSVSGAIQYSQVVKVNTGKLQQGFVIYPNPVSGGNIGIQISEAEKGNYNCRLSNAAGQLLYSKSIVLQGGNASIKLNTGLALPPGTYELGIIGPSGKSEVLKVLVQ